MESDDEVNRDELESFLASAPEGLKGWARAQLARMDARGPGEDRHGAAESEDAADVEDLLDDDDIDGAEAGGTRTGEGRGRASRAGSPRAAGTGQALARRAGVSPLTLVLVALLAAAAVVIVQMQGRGHPGAGMTMPAGHPPVTATMSPSDIAEVDQAEPLDQERVAKWTLNSMVN